MKRPSFLKGTHINIASSSRQSVKVKGGTITPYARLLRPILGITQLVHRKSIAKSKANSKSIAKANNLCTSQFQKGDGANLLIISVSYGATAPWDTQCHRALGHGTFTSA